MKRESPSRGQRRQAPGGLPRDHLRHRRQGRLHPQEADGWSGQFAKVIINMSRRRRGRRLRVRQRRHRWSHPASSSSRWTRASRRRWSSASWPTPDAGRQRNFTDGSYHEVDSSETAFKMAGRMVFGEVARRANPVLLEPMMAVEVTTPDDYMGDVIGDLNPVAATSRPWRRTRRCQAGQGAGSPLRNVWVRWRSAVQDAGSRLVLHAVRLVRRSSQERRRRDHPEGPRRVTR